MPDRLVDLYIEAINQAVAGRPRDMVIGVHVCRGNYKGHYLGEGGYDSIAERLFTRTDADVFLLEYDTPRAGGFAPLRLVPKGRGVVLGLVSSKTPALEEHRHAQAPHRRGEPLHRSRPARAQPAMRLCQQRRRQSADRG